MKKTPAARRWPDVVRVASHRERIQRPPRTRGLALGIVLCLFLGDSPAEAGGDEAGSRPNILMIVTDDQGYSDLGCFGGAVIRTPNLDRLAAGGVRLTSFYVSWPACTPSRGSILTGRYPQRNGLYDMIRNDVTDYGRRMDEFEYAISPEMTLGLDLREVTVAQVMKTAGYATGVIGKWDSGRARRFLPRQRGFDSFYGFANTGIDYWTHERYGVPSLFRDNTPVKEEGYVTDLPSARGGPLHQGAPGTAVLPLPALQCPPRSVEPGEDWSSGAGGVAPPVRRARPEGGADALHGVRQQDGRSPRGRSRDAPAARLGGTDPGVLLLGQRRRRSGR